MSLPNCSSPVPFSRFEEIISRFPEQRLLVVGDLMLDEFIWGCVNRISPEAPVPVIEVQKESCFPGGAANVARNLCEFTSHVSLMGIIGADEPGNTLQKLLTAAGIGTRGVIESSQHQTIVKSRVIARNQQIARIDREKRRPVLPEQQAQAIACFREALPEIDAIILEDYSKGFFSQEIADAFCRMAREVGKVITVDPNPKNHIAWKNVTAIKPNRLEAFSAAGKVDEGIVLPVLADRALLETGWHLIEKWEADFLLLTLSENGMLLFERGASNPTHHTVRCHEVFDVSGAGDTAIALLTLALCSGATAVEAAEISNAASSIVIEKAGTATVTKTELLGLLKV